MPHDRLKHDALRCLPREILLCKTKLSARAGLAIQFNPQPLEGDDLCASWLADPALRLILPICGQVSHKKATGRRPANRAAGNRHICGRIRNRIERQHILRIGIGTSAQPSTKGVNRNGLRGEIGTRGPQIRKTPRFIKLGPSELLSYGRDLHRVSGARHQGAWSAVPILLGRLIQQDSEPAGIPVNDG